MKTAHQFRLALPMAAALLLLAATGAGANTISLTLTQAFTYAGPGELVAFEATVSAPSTNDSAVYLNGDNSFADSPLTVDDGPFWANFPVSLNPGDSTEDTLFTVSAPAGTANGIYTGYFEILGGADGGAMDPVANAAFNVDVGTVPEPGAAWLLGIGLAGLMGAVRRRRRVR